MELRKRVGFGPFGSLMLVWWLMLLGMGSSAAAVDSVCAEVKIVIEQKLSLERQAFDAHMVITNGLDTAALQNVKIDLTFQNADKQTVTATSDPNATGASFFFRTDTITGIAALDGSAGIAPKTEADIHWLIIPAQGTGGSDPAGKLYYVGAQVTYTLNGQESTVEVTPDYIVVRPQPLLELDYFLPSDVHADDPFTDAVEPQVPFTLGVRIRNVGAGTAVNTTIESAQPKIVENRQGLLIGFEILGGYVADQPAGKSLLLAFGDVAPASSVVGRWDMVTTLAGRFVEFDASYTHADSLGGAVTSLISGITTHTLVHDVKVDLPGRDSVRDFLGKDTDVFRLYESEGVDTEVTDQSAHAEFAPSGASYSLTFPQTAGFVHAQVSDPFQGSRTPVRVLRSDGKSLPVENFWLSKTRDSDLVWWYHFNIFDVDSTGSYTVIFGEGSTASISGSVYNDKNANGVRDDGEPGVAVLKVILKGTDTHGAALSAEGYTGADGKFAFGSLNPGTYSLAVATLDGLVDGAALVGTAGGTAEAGKVNDIVLVAGTAAQGYVFAKRTGGGPGEGSADLSVTLGATPLKLVKGDTVTFTVTARNGGPSAVTNAALTLALPEALIGQSGTPSVGSYNAGSWSIGALAAGASATLTVTARIGAASQTLTVLASIGSSLTDPALSNNAASVVLQYDAGSFTVTQAQVEELRLLVLASCPDAQGRDNAACAQSRAANAAAWLSARGYTVRATASLAEFRTALRSGLYNGLWLSGGANKLTTTVLEEVRAAVRRGGALVLEGTPDRRVGELAEVWGGRFSTTAFGQDQVLSITASGTSVQTAGGNWLLELSSATELARFAEGSAIAEQSYGQGHVLTLGFDAIGTLALANAESTLGAFLKGRLDAMQPALPQPALARSYARVETVLKNTGTAPGAARLVTTLPTDMSFTEAVPAPDAVSGQELSWDLALAASETRSVRLGVRMPRTSGSVTLRSTASNAADDSLIGEPAQTFEVEGDNLLVPRVQAGLAALTAGSGIDDALLTQARAAALAAQSAFAAGDYEEALARLTEAETALRALTATVATAERLEIARWMALAETAWREESGRIPSSMAATAGTPQTAEIGRAFGEALAVTVRDAGGAPVPGAQVSFIAPASGPSASFAGGAAVAAATTNSEGVASAPLLTANAEAGDYTVSAVVAGLAQEVAFALTNLPAPVLPASITVVSGSDQSATVETPFAQPLQALVLDAQGQPLAGVGVTFTLPGSGASATFPEAAGATTVSTGSDGIATSPLLTANAVVGSYSAAATVTGLDGSATFALTNRARAPEPLVLTVVAGSEQSAQVATAFGAALQVRVTNQAGLARAGVTVRFSLPESGPSALFANGLATVDALSDDQGLATSGVLTANAVAGGYTAVASADAAAASVSFALENMAAPRTPAAISVVSGSDQSAVIGSLFAQPLRAKVVDAEGVPLAGVEVTFVLPIDGPSARFDDGASSATVSTDAQGLATSPMLTANAQAGSYTANAGVAGIAEVAGFALTNTPVATEPLVVTVIDGTGQSAQVGTRFGKPLQVRVTNAANEAQSGVTVLFSLPESGPSAAFTGGAVQAAVASDADGLATSPELTANGITGSYLATAAAAGAPQSASFTLTNSAVVPVPLLIKVVDGGDQSALVGQLFAKPLQARVTDVANQAKAGVTVRFTLPESGASALFADGSREIDIVTDSSGLATSPKLTANAVVGSWSAIAATTAAAEPASFALTNLPAPRIPARIEAVSGSGQSAVVGSAFAHPLQAKVLDAEGKPLPGAEVSFRLPASGASASFSGDLLQVVVATDEAGLATSPALTANSVVGTYRAQASVGTLAEPAEFALSNSAAPPQPLVLTVTGGSGQSTVVSTRFGQPLAVRVTNTSGIPQAGVSVKFALPESGASALFTGGAATAEVTTDPSGIATSPAFTANGVVGTYSALAMVAGPGEPASFALTNLPAPPPLLLSVVAGADQRATVNTAFAKPLQVRVSDTTGQGHSGVLVRFTLPESGASATFVGGVRSVEVASDATGLASSPLLTANGTAGSYAATAAATGVATSLSLTLTNLPAGPVPASIVPVSGSGQTARITTPFKHPLRAKVRDRLGRPVAGARVAFALPASEPTASFEGGVRTAFAQSDGEGVAVSPALTAGAAAGSYRALATVDGVAEGAAFVLTNTGVANEQLILTIVNGSGQRTLVNTPFNRQLRVKVTDRQKKPQAGVPVLFMLPTSGPSATFPGGALELQVISDNGGMAVAETLTANALVGSYSVIASAPNAEEPVRFELKNTKKKLVGLSLAEGSGGGTVDAEIVGGGSECAFDPELTALTKGEDLPLATMRLRLPDGVLSLELVDCIPGSSVTITTRWPSLQVATGYMNYGHTAISGEVPTWYLPDNLKLEGDTATYTVTDGGSGDDDGTADGVIRAKGGPVIAPAEVPTLAGWAQLLLAALMLLGGGLILRRRPG